MSNPTLLGEVAAKIAGLSTELNSLASGASVLSSVNGASGVFANVNGSGLGGYRFARMKFNRATLSSASTVGSSHSVWFLNAADGTTYESGSSSVTPSRPPDLILPENGATTALNEEIVVPVPIGAAFKILLQNNSGQALASSGNTLDFYPETDFFPSL